MAARFQNLNIYLTFGCKDRIDRNKKISICGKDKIILMFSSWQIGVWCVFISEDVCSTLGKSITITYTCVQTIEMNKSLEIIGWFRLLLNSFLSINLKANKKSKNPIFKKLLDNSILFFYQTNQKKIVFESDYSQFVIEMS